MKCANCRCEIGNLTTCPYCGKMNYQRPAQPQPARIDHGYSGAAPTSRTLYHAPKRRHTGEQHCRSTAMWTFLNTVLLIGIFLLNLLQLFALLL
ncbi:MAG TPA: hypothetical protein H9795_07810 [Candidatus Fournierella merdigallinarum]|nr:hypothetical protein [Candidatus Fournierella merdigallinarum]